MAQSGLWSIRGFTPYASARLISEAGSALSWIALPILVYDLTSSAAWTAAVAAAEAIPYLVLGIIAGTIADRRARSSVMIAAGTVSGLALLSLPVAYLLGSLTAVHVVLAAAVNQTAFVFYDAANFGLIMSLVGRDGVIAANGFLFSAGSVLEAVAPAVVGLLLGRIPVVYVVWADAATFFVSAILLGRCARVIRRERSDSAPHAPVQSFVHGAVEGIRFFWSSPVITRTTLISALLTAVNGGIVALLIVWTRDAFQIDTGDSRLGLFYVAFAVSGVAAGLVVDWTDRWWEPRAALRALTPFSAVLGYVMLLMTDWWAAAILLAVSCALGTGSVILAVGLRQRVIPDRLQSRVNTFGRMLAFGLGYSVGAVVAGALGSEVSPGSALAVLFLFRIAAAGVALLLLPRAEPVRSVPAAAEATEA